MSLCLKYQQHRQMLALALIFMVWFQSPAASAAPGGMKITAAIWSGKSVLASAANFCDGKNSCSYKISPQYIGEAANPANKSFSITWACDDAPNRPQTLRESHDATYKVLQLNCPTPGSAATTKQVAAAHKIDAPANLRDPLFPLKYPTSFHSMLMDSGSNAVKTYVQTYMQPACLPAIKKHLNQKKSFFSKVMRDRFTIAIKDYPYAEVRDGNLFHHTTSSEVPRIANQKNYGELFSYVRTRREASEGELYEWFFYVAADPHSSESYGPINMKVTVSPNTLVLENGGDMPGDSSSHQQANQLIENELIDGDPALAACKGIRFDSAWYNGMLVLLAAEANGIGVIAYYGIDNLYAPNARGYQWLQVLGPWAIQSMETTN